MDLRSDLEVAIRAMEVAGNHPGHFTKDQLGARLRLAAMLMRQVQAIIGDELDREFATLPPDMSMPGGE